MEQINNYSSGQLTTPCFILDESELKRSINGFRQALESHFNAVIIGYSVKTNAIPYCLKIAKDCGAYAEVVSHDEYTLAMQVGFDKSHIVYNGPLKSKETFLEAVLNGAVVNIETKREIEWLAELPKEQIYNVGIRLNCNISHISSEDADGTDDNSRFGFSDETEDFANAIAAIRVLKNIKISGLHLHRTTHSRRVGFYKNLIAHACEVIEKYALNLDYLDVGGGYFGIFPNKPTYQDYADAFYKVLKSHNKSGLKIIVEPGNALVASCFKFLSEVIDIKHIDTDTYAITTDGSRNDIDPFFRKTNYFKELISTNVNTPVPKQIIGGCTCLEYDRLFELENAPLLNVGDRILYSNVGAYTMCLTPLFIRYFPNIYISNKQGFELVRNHWTANEYIMKSKIN